MAFVLSEEQGILRDMAKNFHFFPVHIFYIIKPNIILIIGF